LKKKLNLNLKVSLHPITIDEKKIFEEVARKSADFFETFGGGTNSTDFFTELPPNQVAEDKLNFVICVEEEPVGVIDMVMNFPQEQTWYIGLFVIVPAYRGKGVAQVAFQQLEALVFELGGTALCLAVAEDNERARKFWARNGFIDDNYLPKFKIHGVKLPTYEMVKKF
jgi:RimJ/RimL family protein N-acetyltransferase